MIDKTVEYYNKNAQSFFETTVNADMSLQLNDFIKLLPADGNVLDAGCGSGRDLLNNQILPDSVLSAIGRWFPDVLYLMMQSHEQNHIFLC